MRSFGDQQQQQLRRRLSTAYYDTVTAFTVCTATFDTFDIWVEGAERDHDDGQSIVQPHTGYWNWLTVNCYTNSYEGGKYQ